MAAAHGRSIWLSLDMIGAVGAILSAVASPCCFPLLAAAASWIGLSSVPFLHQHAPILIQVMTAVSVIGQFAAYRQRLRSGPLVLSAMSGSLVAIAYYVSYDVALLYCALTGLGVAALWNVMNNHHSHGGYCS